jgi:hypothetical protein
MRLGWIAVLLASVGFTRVALAEAPAPFYVLAIGHNGLPDQARPGLRELRYADDDAAAFAQFARDLHGRAIILSNFDSDTVRRFPRFAEQARAPTRSELERAVTELNAAFDADRRRGLEPTVLVTYSGHGSNESDALPSLTLADGAFTQEALYAEVLSRLQARFIHVVVDACHAEAIVRPRDAQASTVALKPEEIESSLARITLLGLPYVGAMAASSISTQSHEWDAWQHGVFAHEVLSGLRGAADVNGDLKVEYSEIAAFLSAANREVRDRSARIRPVLKPPVAAPRAPIVDLSGQQRAFLVGRTSRLGVIWVETEDGQRIADLNGEGDHYLRVLVPSNRKLFVRAAGGEAQLTLSPGRRAHFDELVLRRHPMRARGSLDLSLQRGLFAATFGPAYYRGFVDNADEFASVPLPTTGSSAMTAADAADASTTEVAAWVTLGVSGALLVAGAAFGIAALDAKADFDDANGLERQSTDAAQRFETTRGLAIGALIGGAITGGVSYVLFQHR